MTRAVPSLVILVTLFTTACGPTNQAETPSTPEASTSTEMEGDDNALGEVDGTVGASAPCDLLTPNDVATVIGQPFNTGTAEPGNSCLWHSVSDEVSVALSVTPGTQASCVSGMSELGDPISVEGLGSPAFWIGDEDGIGTLSWCGDVETMSMSVATFDPNILAGATFLDVSRRLIEIAVAAR